MDEQLVQELKQAEQEVAATEKELGPNHPDLADKLMKYAGLLRKTEKRALDVVNVEARARAIRAKMYAAEEAAHGTTTVTQPKKELEREQTRAAAIGMYAGYAGILLSLSSLVVNQSFLGFLLPLAVICGIVDVSAARTTLWRVALVAVFCLSSFWCNQSLPANMLVDSTPIERFNYASENPEMVANVKKLGKPISVLDYSICLPDGYQQTADETKDWGRAILFTGTTQPADGRQQATPPGGEPRFVAMLVNLPADLTHPQLLKAARDNGMPPLLDYLRLTSATQELPRFVDLNGVNFARFAFTGSTEQVARAGFAYIGLRNRTLLVIAGDDSTLNGETNTSLLDAAIDTLKKQGAAGAATAPSSGPAPAPAAEPAASPEPSS